MRVGPAPSDLGGRRPAGRRTDEEEKKIGLAPRRQREVGSWVIDEQPLADGDGWQDWPAFHHVDTERHAWIRCYTIGQGATTAAMAFTGRLPT